MLGVSRLLGFNQLVGLLKKVLNQAAMGLLGVPWATARCTEFVGNGNEVVEVSHGSSLPERGVGYGVLALCTSIDGLSWVANSFGAWRIPDSRLR